MTKGFSFRPTSPTSTSSAVKISAHACSLAIPTTFEPQEPSDSLRTAVPTGSPIFWLTLFAAIPNFHCKWFFGYFKLIHWLGPEKLHLCKNAVRHSPTCRYPYGLPPRIKYGECFGVTSKLYISVRD